MPIRLPTHRWPLWKRMLLNLYGVVMLLFYMGFALWWPEPGASRHADLDVPAEPHVLGAYYPDHAPPTPSGTPWALVFFGVGTVVLTAGGSGFLAYAALGEWWGEHDEDDA